MNTWKYVHYVECKICGAKFNSRTSKDAKEHEEKHMLDLDKLIKEKLAT